MSSENKAVVRRFFQTIWNDRQPHQVDDLFTPQSTCQSEAGTVCGKEEFLNQVYHPFVEAFPDLHLEVEEIIGERDVVAVRWLCTGTHTGSAFGLVPTGRRISFRGTSWIQVRDGKMMEGFECWNLGGLMQVLSGGPPTAAMSVA